MFHSSRPSIQVILVALPLALGQPALAQNLGPKDTWDALAAMVGGLGGSLTTAGMLRDGDAIIARSVVVDFDGDLTITLGDVSFAPQGEAVRVTPGAEIGVVSTLGLSGSRREYVVTHDGAIDVAANEAEIRIDSAFGRFGLAQIEASRFGSPLDEQIGLDMTGVSSRFGMTLTEPHSVTGSSRIALADVVFNMSDEMLGLVQRSTQRTEDTRVDFSFEGLRQFDTTQPGWLSRAFADGLAARLTASNGPGTASIDQDMDGVSVVFSMTFGGSAFEFSLAEGVMALSGGTNGLGMSGVVEELPVEVATDRITVAFEMPLIVTETDRRFRYAMGVHDLTIDGGLLAMVGAEGFAGDSVTLDFDAQANGRWVVEITDNPNPSRIPFDLTSVALNTLTTRIGTSALTGNGLFTLTPGALEAMMDGPPDGEGDFTFDLRGGSALLSRLGAAGLIPADQQFMAQMMMSALGRPVGEDHLRSEVSIRPGGQILVNGMPLPF